jgi:hypothetical protein
MTHRHFRNPRSKPFPRNFDTFGETSPLPSFHFAYFQCLAVEARLHPSLQRSSKARPMLKIRRAANGEVVLTLSGRMGSENISELQILFTSESGGRRIILDLKDLTLVDQESVSFLAHCEADGIRLRNCPAYIREWITRQPGENLGRNR